MMQGEKKLCMTSQVILTTQVSVTLFIAGDGFAKRTKYTIEVFVTF